mgnify:FL=1
MAVLLRPGGYATITGPDGLKELDTLSCCHCGGVSFIRPGSGRPRGFCRLCMKPTCGKAKCMDCLPLERMLEESENRGRLRQRMERGY